jgi:hypothetical protein
VLHVRTLFDVRLIRGAVIISFLFVRLLCVCVCVCRHLDRRKVTYIHGSDYEEYCLLGYKNPVRTSQETHYVSATELSRLMLCKI